MAEPNNPQQDSRQVHTTAEESQRELQDAIKGSEQVLATATTVFPFTLFPDTLTVDRTKLTVTKRTFFGSGESMSMHIEDVLNVTAQVGPIFGSVTIISRVLHSQPYTISHFWREDAMRLKRVTQGFIIARQSNIDTTSLTTSELSDKLDQLGKDDHHKDDREV